MRKIIGGKLYDTETAREVGEFSEGGLSLSDFHFLRETLYRKRGGEYFIHGEGGGLSRYAERVGDMWGAGERIVPISHEGAREWSEEHMSADAYESEFGKVGEDGGEGVVYAKVSAGAKRKLEAYAEERGVTQAQALEEILSAL